MHWMIVRIINYLFGLVLILEQLPLKSLKQETVIAKM